MLQNCKRNGKKYNRSSLTKQKQVSVDHLSSTTEVKYYGNVAFETFPRREIFEV